MDILQSSIAQELPFLRAEAEARMGDTFTVNTRASVAYNPTTGLDEETLTLLFTTPGRLKSSGLQPRDAQVGDRTSTAIVRELHIPVTSPVVPDDAVVVVAAIAATSDPTMLGNRFRVAGPAPGSQTTARRFQVEQVLT